MHPARAVFSLSTMCRCVRHRSCRTKSVHNVASEETGGTKDGSGMALKVLLVVNVEDVDGIGTAQTSER